MARLVTNLLLKQIVSQQGEPETGMACIAELSSPPQPACPAQSTDHVHAQELLVIDHLGIMSERVDTNFSYSFLSDELLKKVNSEFVTSK